MFYKVFLNHPMNLGFQVLPHCINGQPMFMTTVCTHTCRTSILVLYPQPNLISCFIFIIANNLSKNHDRKRPAIFIRLRACFFAPWAAGMGSPAGSPYHVDVGGSCIWRASRREAPTASQWTICTFRPALHSSLFTLHLALATGLPWAGSRPPAPVLTVISLLSSKKTDKKKTCRHAIKSNFLYIFLN